MGTGFAVMWSSAFATARIIVAHAPPLTSLAARAGVPLRAFLRTRGGAAEALGLTAPDVSEATLAAAMVRDPILVERPVVEGPRGVAVCRPPEKALDLL